MQQINAEIKYRYFWFKNTYFCFL